MHQGAPFLRSLVTRKQSAGADHLRVAAQIMSEVPGLQHQAVQSALNVLQENGHVYTASDEYHYRSTIY